tara:strand:- start:161 stop:553 length:393 start_codon:yes stop_codon:yes gene_type:complete
MNNKNIKMGSNKSFGIVFFVVFALISIYPIINGGELKKWPLLIAVVFLILGIFKSNILTPLNKLWFKFGIFLGMIFSPIIMGIIFFLVVTPIAIIMRVLKKDILYLKKNNNKNTYWINKTGVKSKMKNQF